MRKDVPLIKSYEDSVEHMEPSSVSNMDVCLNAHTHYFIVTKLLDYVHIRIRSKCIIVITIQYANKLSFSTVNYNVIFLCVWIVDIVD